MNWPLTERSCFICSVAAFIKTKDIKQSLHSYEKNTQFGNGKFWKAKESEYDQLTYSGEVRSEDIWKFATRIFSDLQFLAVVLDGNYEYRNVANRVEKVPFMAYIAAKEGGCGGRGGDGGLGGCPGRIIIHPTLPAAIQKKFVKRIHGLSGSRGEGGLGGYHGEKFDGKKAERNRRGLPGNDTLNNCTDDCENISDEDWENEIISNLRNIIGQLGGDERWLYFSQLAIHDWAVEHVFTTDMVVREYLNQRNKMDSMEKSTLVTRLQTELKCQEWLEKFLKLKAANPGEEKVIYLILASSYSKTLTLQSQLERIPVILDLQKYLATCSITLDKIEQSNICAAVLEHRVKFEERIRSKIMEKKRQMGQMITSSLENIQKHFAQQQRKCTQDLDGYIALIKTRGNYTKVEQILKLVEGPSRFGDNMTGTENIVNGTVRSVCGALSVLFVVLKPRFKIPDALTGNALHDHHRFRQDTMREINRQIVLLEKAISDDNDLKEPFSKFTEKLRVTLQDISPASGKKKDKIDQKWFLACLRKLEEIRETMLLEVKRNRGSCAADNEKKIRLLDDLYLDLLMADTDSELYTKTKSSVFKSIEENFGETTETKFAKDRKAALEKKFVTTIEHLLEMVQSELERDAKLGDRKWKVKDVLMEVKDYLGSFVKGLPSERDFQQGFKKIERAIGMHASLWKFIGECEGKLEMVTFLGNTNITNIDNELQGYEIGERLKWKVKEIQVLTQAELLLLEYEKIQRGFLQWAFPYAGRFLAGVKSEMDHIQNILLGKSMNVTEEDITRAAEKCRKIILYFQQIYEKSCAESTPEDDAWCTHQFLLEPGAHPFYVWSHKKYRNLIRGLFLGYPVRFVADVRESPRGMGAVKVNKSIELRFLYNDRSQKEYQQELDIFLVNFVVEMTHEGRSCYRVDSKYYVISGEPLTLLGNVETMGVNEGQGRDGGKITENDTRLKMNDYVLSPYTQWTFKMRLAHPEQHAKPKEMFIELAEKFSHCVDLHLVGRGRYLDEEGEGWKKKKPTGVDKYYEQVETRDIEKLMGM